MKRFAICLAVLLVWGAAGAAAAEEAQKSKWYIGFGVGSGQLRIEGESMTDYLDGFEDLDADSPVTLHFGVGGIVNPKLHLGFDMSTIYQYAEEDDDDDANVDLQVNNYMFAAHFYPVKKGFFIKAGTGFSLLTVDVDDGPEGDDRETYDGLGYLLGSGYDFWLGKSFNLGIHAEFSQQYYNDSEAPDETHFFSVYVSFYWF